MKKLLYIILLAATSTYGATVANVQKLSSFGTTNSINTNDLITVSTQPGTASEHLGGITFGDLITQFHNLEGYYNVKMLGAKGDGVTDDTAAFQYAYNRGGTLFVPYSSNGYKVKNLLVYSNTFTHGIGGRSKLIYDNNTNGFMIDCKTNTCISFKNLEFDGGSNVNFRLGSGLTGGRAALHLYAYGNTTLDDIDIHGFSSNAIVVNALAQSSAEEVVLTNNNTFFNNVRITKCFRGVLYDSVGAEYQMAQGLNIRHCYFGLEIDAGNVNINNSLFSENYLGAYVGGAINNGHGNLNNCQFTHNNISFWTQGLLIGFNIVGCQLFSGAILIDNSVGVQVHDCIFDLNYISIINGSQYCSIMNNKCFGTGSNLYTNTSTSSVVWNNRNLTTGGWIGTPGFTAVAYGTNIDFVGGISVTNGVNYQGSVSNVASIGQTANRWAGRGRLTAGQQTYIVTNNIVTPNTIAIATLSTNDATATSISATPSAGLLTLKANAAATGNADISWVIITP